MMKSTVATMGLGSVRCMNSGRFGEGLRMQIWPGRAASLRRHLRGHVDPARRGFPKRMRHKIELRDQRHIGGPDRISERLLIATCRIEGGRQVDAVAMRAGHPRSLLKASIELVRSGRLTEIESLCAHVNSDSDPMIPSHNVAGEERARNGGGAADGPGIHASCFGVQVNLLMNRH